MFLHFLVVVLQEHVHSAPEEESKENTQGILPSFVELLVLINLVLFFGIEKQNNNEPGLVPPL